MAEPLREKGIRYLGLSYSSSKDSHTPRDRSQQKEPSDSEGEEWPSKEKEEEIHACRTS